MVWEVGSNNQKNVALGLILALVLSLNLFVFTPLSIYLGNSQEFITPLTNLLGWWAIPTISLLLVLMLVGMVCPANWYRRYLVLLASVSLLVWIQSNLLVWDYGLLDGRSIDWASMSWQGWVDGLTWVVVIAAGLLFSIRVFVVFSQAAVLLFIVQAIQLLYGVYSIQSQPALQTKFDQAGMVEIVASFSAEENVLHLVLDGFQSDIFDELLQHPVIGPDYRQKLSGFTFYRETLGIFPYTRFAVPAYLSGQIYDNTQPKNEFIGQALAGKSLFTVASSAGMELDVASIEYWAPLYAKGNVTNSYVIPEGGHGTEFEFRLANTAKLIDLALFRAAPHFLKRKIYYNQRWLITPLLMDTEYLQFLYFAHTKFLNEIVDRMDANRITPTYKYIHVMNTHNPMVVDAECRYAGGAIRTDRASLLNQSKCTLDTVMTMLDKMQEQGVYENSLIILHGDHGGWVPHSGYQPDRVSTHREIPYWAVSVSSPLLAIKPPRTNGDIVISDRLVSLTDIPDTVAEIMNWPQQFGGRSVLTVGEDELRARHFYLYEWQKNAWETDFAGPIHEFEISGRHYESAWLPKNILMPGVE